MIVFLHISDFLRIFACNKDNRIEVKISNND